MRASTTRLSAWAWAIATLAAATGCRSERACDIREPECQRDLFYLVLDVRGQAWDAWTSPPPVEVVTVDEYRARLEADAAGSGAQDGRLSWDPAYRLLGLLGRNADSDAASIELSVAHVLAYYSTATGSVTVIDRGVPADPEEASTILAHEYVHALQDRDVGLREYRNTATSSDEDDALKSMIEGEATLYDLLVNLRLRGLGDDEIGWNGYFASYRAYVDETAGSSSTPLEVAWAHLPYATGAEYLHHAYERGGPPEVEFAIRQKPESLAFVLDPTASVRAPLTCRGPAAPEGYAQIAADCFGAAALYAFAIKLLSGDTTWDLMRAWSDDELRLYRSPTGASAVAWTVRLKSATEFARHLSLLENLAVRLEGRTALRLKEQEVVIAVADYPAVLSGWDLQSCAAQQGFALRLPAALPGGALTHQLGRMSVVEPE